MSDAQEKKLEPVWCIAANVIYERRFGPGGAETRKGTKHFAPGAKVHIVNFHGTGRENVTVVGRHRKSHRYITLVTPLKWLVNWRVELIYSPYVIRKVIAYEAYEPPLKWYELSFPYLLLVFLGLLKQKEDENWAGSDEAKMKAEAILEDMQEWHESARRTQPPVTRASREKSSGQNENETQESNELSS